MAANPFASILGLASAQAPQIGLEDMRRRRLLEMERNLELAQGNPRMAIGATHADVNDLKTDMAKDPYTGDLADEEVVYQSPLAKAKRKDALARLLMPERLKSQNALELETLRGKNALDVAREKGQQAGAGGDLFTPEGQNVAAQFFGATGKMVPGMTRSPQTIAGVVNAYGAQNPEANVGANVADYEANKSSLGKLRSTQDAATAFITTADANADRLIEAMKGAPGLGIPLFDAPIRAGARALGHEGMKGIDAIRNSVSQEYSRILSSPGMGGVVTQSERDALHQIFSDAATPGQVIEAIQQLKAEAQNRLDAYNQQINTVQGRLQGSSAPAPAPQQYLRGSGWE